MKAILKKVYLNLRRYLLRGMTLFFFDKGLSDFSSGQGIRKVLFLRIDRIGDMVLSTPALKALKQGFPRCELVVLASPSNGALLAHNPHADRVIIYRRGNGLREKIGIIKQLRGYGFDLAIDPYPDYEVKTALIALLSGARKRIGYASYGREVFFNVEAQKIRDNHHFVDLTLGVLTPLGIHATERTPEVFIAYDERRWARNWLQERGVRGRSIVGIHPGGYYESQRWWPERFAELADRLGKDKGIIPIIFGGPGEEFLAQKIRLMAGGGVLTSLQENIRRFAALISCCSVFVCNNSGPLHIAAGLGIPTVSVMGPTVKERWMPIGEIHRVFRRDELPCIGCNLGYCKIKTHDCMRLITSSMVSETVEYILGMKRSS